MPPSVDIVIRTKDRPVVLRRALRSVVEQTFEDWRAIVVNDGGDPRAVREVLDGSGAEERTTIIDHAPARGRWQAANAGVRAADAPLLVLHDDDDSWHPEFLERATGYLTDHPEAMGVVSREQIVWEEVHDDALVEVGREMFQPQLTAPLLGDLLLFNRFVPIGFLYRRELHEELGPYREDLAVVGDWDFNLRVLSRWPLEFLADEPYAFWHQRRGVVEGSAGNSVIAESRNHRHYDALVRDAHLRELVQRDGYGDTLHLTKFVDQRFLDLEHHVDQEVRDASAHLHRRIDALEVELTRVVREASTIERGRRWLRRRAGRA